MVREVRLNGVEQLAVGIVLGLRTARDVYVRGIINTTRSRQAPVLQVLSGLLRG